MKERRSKKLIWCFLFSFLIHMLLLLLIVQEPKEPKEPDLRALDVELLKTKKRLADIAKPKEEKRPKKADFIGQYDSTVKEEQVAATPSKPGVPQPQKSLTKPPTPQSVPEELPEKKEKLATLFSKRKAQPQKKTESSKDSAWKKPGSFPEDFYPDYKVGPHTYLNVLRFPNVQYFVRLKRIFKMTFNPVPALRPYVYTNQVSRGHVEVVLGVVVDSSGRLARLFVIRGSGFGTYDQEALRTVRDSSPFAKPPSKILGSDNQLRMSWTFTVYL
jgi:TonB family protein